VDQTIEKVSYNHLESKTLELGGSFAVQHSAIQTCDGSTTCPVDLYPLTLTSRALMQTVERLSEKLIQKVKLS